MNRQMTHFCLKMSQLPAAVIFVTNNSKLFLDNKIVQLSETEIEVLSYRIDHPTKSLCEIHYRKEVVMFSLNQKNCADPDSRHKSKVKTGLLPVSLRQVF